MRLHPELVVLGYSQAAMFLRRADSPPLAALITIHGQREHALTADGVPHILDLAFDDCEAPNPRDLIQAARLRLRQRENAETGLRLCPPTPEHARAIVDFAESIQNIEGLVLCQCEGGISRSPAAALLCLAAWTGPGMEEYCVEHLLAIRPCALPHPDLVAFGDELLHREGQLAEALRRFCP